MDLEGNAMWAERPRAGTSATEWGDPAPFAAVLAHSVARPVPGAAVRSDGSSPATRAERGRRTPRSTVGCRGAAGGRSPGRRGCHGAVAGQRRALGWPSSGSPADAGRAAAAPPRDPARRSAASAGARPTGRTRRLAGSVAVHPAGLLAGLVVATCTAAVVVVLGLLADLAGGAVDRSDSPGSQVPAAVEPAGRPGGTAQDFAHRARLRDRPPVGASRTVVEDGVPAARLRHDELGRGPIG